MASSSSPPAADATAPPLAHEITYPAVSPAALAAGRCTIIGFGSLLSARSCSSTFATVLNFRSGVIRGWRRVFAHAAPIFIERGIANQETKEMSSLSVEPCEESAMLRVSVFEIPIADLPAFYAREMEFRWVQAPVFDASGANIDSAAIDGQGLLCAAYTDEEYRLERMGGTDRDAFTKWGITKIWRADLLPCRVYLRHVVLAAAGMDHAFGSQHGTDRLEWNKPDDAATSAGVSTAANVALSAPPFVSSNRVSLASGAILDSFLDATFLGDRRTTIRQYLATPSLGGALMCTQPPPEFNTRYNG